MFNLRRMTDKALLTGLDAADLAERDQYIPISMFLTALVVLSHVAMLLHAI